MMVAVDLHMLQVSSKKKSNVPAVCMQVPNGPSADFNARDRRLSVAICSEVGQCMVLKCGHMQCMVLCQADRGVPMLSCLCISILSLYLYFFAFVYCICNCLTII